MRKLLHGLVDFRERLAPKYQDTFAQLALGQKPDVLFVGCSDSRVVPNLFASTEPGDLFVIRNVGNLVAPCDASGVNRADRSEAAAIEYAIERLGVADIVICGHSECGATLALLDDKMKLPPNLANWLQYAQVSLDRLNNTAPLDPTLSRHNQLSQANVLQQLDHLRTYPSVVKALAEKRLRLHAWYFDIASIEVETYDPELNKFVVIDRDVAAKLLKSLGEDDDKGLEEPQPAWQYAAETYRKMAAGTCCTSQNHQA
ncbi:MAG: carbonic anhydrase [Chitinophagaceae bacterium]|nr:carbonic anhydrase [Oligoflexus sp.]